MKKNAEKKNEALGRTAKNIIKNFQIVENPDEINNTLIVFVVI